MAVGGLSDRFADKETSGASWGNSCSPQETLPVRRSTVRIQPELSGSDGGRTDGAAVSRTLRPKRTSRPISHFNPLVAKIFSPNEELPASIP